MKRKWISIILIMNLVVWTAGCATLEEHKGAAVGAGVGGAAGAAAGAIFGKSTGAAVVGGLLGALAGGVIGHYAYDKKKTKEETADTYNYNPSQGAMLRIEEANISPQTVSPGEEVQLSMTYAVLTPSSGIETSITEIREITREGEIVGRPEARVSRVDGTYTSTIPLRLPPNAPEGEYRVTSTVKSPTASDVRVSYFTVK